MRRCNFLRLMSNKITSRSYSYFLKVSYSSFLRNWFFQLCQKLQSLVKKPQGILEVKRVSYISLEPLLERSVQRIYYNTKFDHLIRVISWKDSISNMETALNKFLSFITLPNLKIVRGFFIPTPHCIKSHSTIC
jgi:hypothetical protein